MAQVPVTPLKSNVGLLAQTATVTPASIMPGGVPYSIASGTLAAGDRIELSFSLVRRGAQHTQGITHNLLIAGASVWGGTLALQAISDGLWVTATIHVVTTASQSSYGASMPSGGAQNYGFIVSAVNLATTALTIDFLACLAAAATDTYGLESFKIQLVKAA